MKQLKIRVSSNREIPFEDGTILPNNILILGHYFLRQRHHISFFNNLWYKLKCLKCGEIYDKKYTREYNKFLNAKCKFCFVKGEFQKYNNAVAQYTKETNPLYKVGNKVGNMIIIRPPRNIRDTMELQCPKCQYIRVIYYSVVFQHYKEWKNKPNHWIYNCEKHNHDWALYKGRGLLPSV